MIDWFKKNESANMVSKFADRTTLGIFLSAFTMSFIAIMDLLFINLHQKREAKMNQGFQVKSVFCNFRWYLIAFSKYIFAGALEIVAIYITSPVLFTAFSSFYPIVLTVGFYLFFDHKFYMGYVKAIGFLILATIALMLFSKESDVPVDDNYIRRFYESNFAFVAFFVFSIIALNIFVIWHYKFSAPHIDRRTGLNDDSEDDEDKDIVVTPPPYSNAVSTNPIGDSPPPYSEENFDSRTIPTSGNNNAVINRDTIYNNNDGGALTGEGNQNRNNKVPKNTKSFKGQHDRPHLSEEELSELKWPILTLYALLGCGMVANLKFLAMFLAHKYFGDNEDKFGLLEIILSIVVVFFKANSILIFDWALRIYTNRLVLMIDAFSFSIALSEVIYMTTLQLYKLYDPAMMNLFYIAIIFLLLCIYSMRSGDKKPIKICLLEQLKHCLQSTCCRRDANQKISSKEGYQRYPSKKEKGCCCLAENEKKYRFGKQKNISSISLSSKELHSKKFYGANNFEEMQFNKIENEYIYDQNDRDFGQLENERGQNYDVNNGEIEIAYW